MRPRLLFPAMIVLLLGAASCAGPKFSPTPIPRERAELFDSWLPKRPKDGLNATYRRRYADIISGRLSHPQLSRLVRGDHYQLKALLTLPEAREYDGAAAETYCFDLIFALFVVGDETFSTRLRTCPPASLGPVFPLMSHFLAANRESFPKTAAFILRGDRDP